VSSTGSSPDQYRRPPARRRSRAGHGAARRDHAHPAFAAPWGFAPPRIEIPVLITYGQADVLVPPAHGEWLAATIPAATVVVSEHGGHLPGDPVTEIAENMAWLRPGIVPPPGR
jgi:pimeloyl-ACP methyl ester carboxylesterase